MSGILRSVLQLDTGAMMINHEAPESLVEEIAPLIGYIHASEPDLVLLGEGEAYHDRVASELRRYLPDHIVSIEMLPPKNEPCTSALERVLRYAIEHYGSMTQIDDSTGRIEMDSDIPNNAREQCRYRLRSASLARTTSDYCVVIPVINEGERIQHFLVRLVSLQISRIADVIIVDSGSNDGRWILTSCRTAAFAALS